MFHFSLWELGSVREAFAGEVMLVCCRGPSLMTVRWNSLPWALFFFAWIASRLLIDSFFFSRQQVLGLADEDMPWATCSVDRYIV